MIPDIWCKNAAPWFVDINTRQDLFLIDFEHLLMIFDYLLLSGSGFTDSPGYSPASAGGYGTGDDAWNDDAGTPRRARPPDVPESTHVTGPAAAGSHGGGRPCTDQHTQWVIMCENQGTLQRWEKITTGIDKKKTKTKKKKNIMLNFGNENYEKCFNSIGSLFSCE